MSHVTITKKKATQSPLCRCGHPYMPAHDTSCYGCDVEGCRCREFTPQGSPAWNEEDYAPTR